VREGTRRGGVREDGKVTSKLGRRSLPVMRAPRGREQPQDKSSGEVDGRTRRRERRSEVRAERLARAGGKEHERSFT